MVQAGFQLPDWSRRGFSDRTNVGGTYAFADLASYAAGTPYAFTQQAGNGDLALLEKQVGMYLKDDWQALAGLSLSFGLRYDWQNCFHDTNNLAPRFSVAYAPSNRKRSVQPGCVCPRHRPPPQVCLPPVSTDHVHPENRATSSFPPDRQWRVISRRTSFPAVPSQRAGVADD